MNQIITLIEFSHKIENKAKLITALINYIRTADHVIRSFYCFYTCNYILFHIELDFMSVKNN